MQSPSTHQTCLNTAGYLLYILALLSQIFLLNYSFHYCHIYFFNYNQKFVRCNICINLNLINHWFSPKYRVLFTNFSLLLSSHSNSQSHSHKRYVFEAIFRNGCFTCKLLDLETDFMVSEAYRFRSS